MLQTMTFNEVSERARRESARLANLGRVMVVTKVDDPQSCGPAYTFFPPSGDWRRIPRLQAAFRFGRELRK